MVANAACGTWSTKLRGSARSTITALLSPDVSVEGSSADIFILPVTWNGARKSHRLSEAEPSPSRRLPLGRCRRPPSVSLLRHPRAVTLLTLFPMKTKEAAESTKASGASLAARPHADAPAPLREARQAEGTSFGTLCQLRPCVQFRASRRRAAFSHPWGAA